MGRARAARFEQGTAIGQNSPSITVFSAISEVNPEPQMLEDLQRAGARKIVLVTHSMGTQLTMEVLRQMTLREDRATFSRISAVVLLSPDISPALFRAQAEAIGDLPAPFVIFTSQNDPALRLSARLTGVPRCHGNIRGSKKLRG